MKRMMHTAAIAAAVIAAAAFSTRPTFAAEPDTPPKAEKPETPAPAEPPPAPDKPLTAELKKAGIDTGGIAVYGFVEGSFTYAASNPPDDFITGRVFDFESDQLTLNQIDLTVEKVAATDKFDVGFKIEGIYGSDARLIHSNGLNFYSSTLDLSPENQFDLVQAYVDVGLGNGWLVRGGKMVTHMGFETINPTTNPLYSHTYLFGFAIPFTHTGVMVFKTVNDQLTLMGGISRGWDQALEDNNDSIDYMGQVKYVFNDKTTAYLNVITGPEQDDNNSDYRTVIDGILTYAATDKCSLTLNGDYGFEPIGDDDASWYGLAIYSGYKFCDEATLNVRAEWFNDEDGARGIGDTVYEGTLGVAIKPWAHDDLGSNFVIRPELRIDYSENGIFDGGTDYYQFTAAVDAIFSF
jgi:hypothetical protein